MRFWFKLNKEVAAIIDSLRDQPERWANDEFVLYLNEVDSGKALIGFPRQWYSPLRIWIANGSSSLKLYDKRVEWDFYSRRKLWKAYGKWKRLPRSSAETSPVLAALEKPYPVMVEQDGKILKFPKAPAS